MRQLQMQLLVNGIVERETIEEIPDDLSQRSLQGLCAIYGLPALGYLLPECKFDRTHQRAPVKEP